MTVRPQQTHGDDAACDRLGCEAPATGYDVEGMWCDEHAVRPQQTPGGAIRQAIYELGWRQDQAGGAPNISEALTDLDALFVRLEQAERALRGIADNAESWHGPEGLGSGHARALAVIAATARAALSGLPSQETP